MNLWKLNWKRAKLKAIIREGGGGGVNIYIQTQIDQFEKKSVGQNMNIWILSYLPSPPFNVLVAILLPVNNSYYT